MNTVKINQLVSDAYRRTVVFCVLNVLLASPVFAGGFKIQDQSTRAMGMIDAFVAGADDASAVYYNPAGITQLIAPQFVGNFYVGHSTVYYDDPNGSDTSDGRVYVVPSGYFAMPLNEDNSIFFGLGMYSPFGLGSRWGDDTTVSTYTTLSEIRLVNINPTIAWKITDRLSVGAGIDYYKTQVISRYIDPVFTGGEIDLDAKGDGWGYNLGLQFQATDTVALGLTYRSPVKVALEGDAEFDGIASSYDADSELDFPAMFAAGISWQATEKLRLELAAEWDKWSTRDSQTINIDFPATVPLPSQQIAITDWDDSWVFMLGAEYQLDEQWTLRGGYGYNETPVPSGTADPSLPTGDTHALAIGAGYKLNDNITLDVATVVAYGEEQTLTNANAPNDSEYDSIATFFSVGINWTF
jgi:long-chain fatty acid transport protein